LAAYRDNNIGKNKKILKLNKNKRRAAYGMTYKILVFIQFYCHLRSELFYNIQFNFKLNK